MLRPLIALPFRATVEFAVSLASLTISWLVPPPEPSTTKEPPMLAGNVGEAARGHLEVCPLRLERGQRHRCRSH